MNKTWRIILIVLAVIVVCCLAAVSIYVGYRLLTRPKAGTGGPLVYFVSPVNGETLQTGIAAMVHIVARDEGKVSRVELWVNGDLVANEHSPLEGGINPFPLNTVWLPDAAGEYKLTARAYNQAGNDSIGEILLTVTEEEARAEPDRDDDGFPDSMDVCPDQVGLEPDGCPPAITDVDGDGVEDILDECPEVAGAPSASGCPDADGDGVPDSEDVCPDVAGGMRSETEAGCPADPSTDRDGDGVADSEDACPDEAGSPIEEGCPVEEAAPSGGDDEAVSDDTGGEVPEDADGDGVMDAEDRCPDEAGTESGFGCQDGAPDRDGDGFPDSVDLCADEAGVEPDGCPAPGTEETETGDAGWMHPGDWGFDFSARRFVEFQALTFNVNQDYEEVYCYAGLNQSMPDLYGPFHSGGEHNWRVTDYLESIPLISQAGGEVHVVLNCYAYSGDPGHPEFHALGHYEMRHPESDWDGRIITARVEPVDYGGASATGNLEGFQATYRMCTPSCTGTELPAPVLEIRNDPFMGQVLAWSWSGDEDNIDHFEFYYTPIRGTIPMYWHHHDLPKGYRGRSISDLEPVCGEELTFGMKAAVGEHGEQGSYTSAMSNLVTWAGPPCSQRARITFSRIEIYNMRDGVRDGQVGPVFGNLYASGSMDYSLVFDGDDFPYGVVMDANGSTSINALFRTIRELDLHEGICSGSTCHHYSAPEVNYIEMDLTAGTDLTIGVNITDEDVTRFQTLIRDEITIPYNEIVPGEYQFIYENVILYYYINTEVTDAAGGGEEGRGPLPDLQVTKVEKHPLNRQVLTWVVNTGAPISGQSFHLSYLTVEGGNLIEEMEYENISLATNEGMWLPSTRTDIPISNVVVFVDSAYEIYEAHEDNNQYITPISYQVSLDKILNQSFCEHFFNTYAEFYYYYSVGTGPDEDHIRWKVFRMRYPESGYNIIDRNADLEDFYRYPAAEDPQYTIQMAVPENFNIYIILKGIEHDVAGGSDTLGTMYNVYTPEQYQAGRIVDQDGAEHLNEHTCTDNEPSGPPYNFLAWFTIERAP